MIKVTPQIGHGYGANCFAVRNTQDFDQLRRWMNENNVDHWHISSGPQGIGFQVKSNVEWFILKWL